MAQRQNLNGNAYLHAAGTRSDRTGNAERCRQYRPARLEMEFGEPHHIESQLFGRVDLLHRFVESFTVAPTPK
jgi:hypothetical protein